MPAIQAHVPDFHTQAIIGIDPHKGSHTAVVIDCPESVVDSVRVDADRHLRKQAEGKSRKEALRALKRRISDAVYQRLADALR